jgi:pimeloyl-ACP methyl ester carboxylesterase
MLATAATPWIATQAADPPPDPEYIRRLIPEQIEGQMAGGELLPLRFEDRNAYVIRPTIRTDKHRRWVWIFPFWLGVNDGHGRLHHREYVEAYLAKGYHVAGVDVGTSCGSPTAAALCERFRERITREHRLSRRSRLVVQSNGGLIGYAWAYRNPKHVERIGGICPATDFRTWPGLENVINFPLKGLDYGLTLDSLKSRIAELNPIDNLRPLAREKVRILHVHGDKDELVPTDANSLELKRRYEALGGNATIVLIPGLGHGGKELYASKELLNFMLG